MVRAFQRLAFFFLTITASMAFSGEAAKGGKGGAKAPAKTPRCAEMDYGPALSASWGLKNNTTMKGLAVTLNKEKPAYLVFDTELLRASVAWTGDYTDWQGLVFVHNWGKARGPNVTGKIAWQNSPGPGWADANKKFDDPRPNKEGPLPKSFAQYKGHYLHGDTVVFSYSVHGVHVLESHAVEWQGETPVFTRKLTVAPSTQPLLVSVTDTPGVAVGVSENAKLEKSGDRVTVAIPPHTAVLNVAIVIGKEGAVKEPSDLTALTQGGPARWAKTLENAGKLAADDAGYVLDTIEIPEENPWKSWMRLSALDFFSDGRAVVTTWSGDVWIVSGLDEKLAKVSWKRFASGLLQPLGVKVVNDEIYVLAHGPIVKLKDLNNDGEADYYENFNSDCIVTDNYHEFATDLQTDAEGNFYFLKGAPALAGRKDFDRFTAHHGALLKVAKDGSKLEVICNGFREPNGLVIAPDGTMTVTDNQGNWTPECPLNRIRPGGFYGMIDPAKKGAAPEREPALLWFPMSVDNSSGGGVYVTHDSWGPLKGRMIHSSYGKSAIYTILFDAPGSVASAKQAAVVRFPMMFSSGVMRLRFHPKDGQLYAVGLKGWGSNANRDGCFQRVRYTGKPTGMPIGYETTKTGVKITFAEALDAARAADPSYYTAEGFNVVRSVDYGSPEFALTDPKSKKREPLEIKSVAVSADGKTIDVQIVGFRPMTNFVMKYDLLTATGTPVKNEFNATVNALP